MSQLETGQSTILIFLRHVFEIYADGILHGLLEKYINAPRINFLFYFFL